MLKRTALGLVVFVFVALLAAVPAAAGRLVTWKTSSRYVDPTKVDNLGSPLGERLRVNVWLPSGYDGRRRFPVLYLLHGLGGKYSDWEPEVRAVASGLGAVVVMPEGDAGWYTNWWNGGRRGAPGWERYHLDELIPLVERRLRIRAGRRWHAIAGASMGGLGALFYATQRPGYFGAAASFSGVIAIERPEVFSLFDVFTGQPHVQIFGDPVAQRFYWTGHDPTALVANLRHTRVFVARGNGEPGNPTEAQDSIDILQEQVLGPESDEFVASARRAGVKVVFRPQQGIHTYTYFRRHLRQAIRWGFFRPAPTPRRWNFRTVAQSARVWGIQLRFSQPPSTVETIRRSGRKLSGSGHGQVKVTIAPGCNFTTRLPFESRLTRHCSQLRPGPLG